MLYRFTIELSDIDRNIYQTLEFRVAQHPSEIPTYLLTKVLAYVLSYEEGLEFSGSGLSDPEAPAMKTTSPAGAIELWIEIGNPSAKKNYIKQIKMLAKLSFTRIKVQTF